jgi:hypothetical protein
MTSVAAASIRRGVAASPIALPRPPFGTQVASGFQMPLTLARRRRPRRAFPLPCRHVCTPFAVRSPRCPHQRLPTAPTQERPFAVGTDRAPHHTVALANVMHSCVAVALAAGRAATASP